MNSLISGLAKVRNISLSGLTIYDPIQIGDTNFWLTSEELSAEADSLDGLITKFKLREE